MGSDDPKRQAAIERLQAKRGVQANLVSYLGVNGLLVVIWAVSGGGFFWPIWVMVFWGFGLAMHAWSVYGRGGITEDDIAREMGKGGDDIVA
jgi:uncharacterized membrane protein YecN with MAPEG domain